MFKSLVHTVNVHALDVYSCMSCMQCVWLLVLMQWWFEIMGKA